MSNSTDNENNGDIISANIDEATEPPSIGAVIGVAIEVTSLLSTGDVDIPPPPSANDPSTTINFDNICSICLNEIQVTSYADGCLHKFCGRCLFEWARRSQLCPICRTSFANIITNVLSDTEYEVIPLEDRRAPVFNFPRDSWWGSRNQPSNRNIFAVRQFPQRQHQQQHLPTAPSQSQHPSTTAQSPLSENEVIRNQSNLENSQQAQQDSSEIEISPVIRGMENLFVSNRRPRRIIWSSNHRQFNRPPNRQFQRSPGPLAPPNPSSQIFSQNVSHQSRSNNSSYRPHNYNRGHHDGNYYNNGHHQFVNNMHIQRHPYPQRPMRPLVGVRQENTGSHQPQFNNNVNQSNFHDRQRYSYSQHYPHQSYQHQHPNQHSHSHTFSSQHQHQNQHPHQHIHPHPNSHLIHRGGSPTFKRNSRPNERARRR